MTRRNKTNKNIPFTDLPEGAIDHMRKKITEESVKVLESVSKVVEPAHIRRVRSINKLKFWCTACTATYEIHLKNLDGTFMQHQQICPHMTLKDYEMLY